MNSVSDIKLIRTDTTLDLSQKAEKRCRKFPAGARVVAIFGPPDMVVGILSHPLGMHLLHVLRGGGPRGAENMASCFNGQLVYLQT